MQTCSTPRAAGMTFLASGMAFLSLALAGQEAFYAVALSMLTLGLVFLAKGRRPR